MPTLTFRQVEELAVKRVMEMERSAGRDPIDTRREPGAPTDIRSGDRLIEVKAAAASTRGADVWLEPAQYHAAMSAPERFYLYLVDNVGADVMTIKVIHGEQLRRLLQRVREKRHYELPVPVAEYDAAPPGA